MCLIGRGCWHIVHILLDCPSLSQITAQWWFCQWTIKFAHCRCFHCSPCAPWIVDLGAIWSPWIATMCVANYRERCSLLPRCTQVCKLFIVNSTLKFNSSRILLQVVVKAFNCLNNFGAAYITVVRWNRHSSVHLFSLIYSLPICLLVQYIKWSLTRFYKSFRGLYFLPTKQIGTLIGGCWVKGTKFARWYYVHGVVSKDSISEIVSYMLCNTNNLAALFRWFGRICLARQRHFVVNRLVPVEPW